jgi:hypothetical protein
MIALAIRELALRTLTEKEKHDLGAFLLLQLREIHSTVDQSASAWEKRDYWVKADQFRMQWRWAEILSKSIEGALRSGDWNALTGAVSELAGKVSSVELPKRIPQPLPWENAWEKFSGS